MSAGWCLWSELQKFPQRFISICRIQTDRQTRILNEREMIKFGKNQPDRRRDGEKYKVLWSVLCPLCRTIYLLLSPLLSSPEYLVITPASLSYLPSLAWMLSLSKWCWMMFGLLDGRLAGRLGVVTGIIICDDKSQPGPDSAAPRNMRIICWQVWILLIVGRLGQLTM